MKDDNIIYYYHTYKMQYKNNMINNNRFDKKLILNQLGY